MLTKAILTGGVLSALVGFSVYFGTEGADAQTNANDTRVEIAIEDSELAGAPDTAVGKPTKLAQVEQMDAKTPPSEDSKPKPKTKWLDQYLKRSKPAAKADTMSDVKASDVQEADIQEPEADVIMDKMEEAVESPKADKKKAKRLRIKKRKDRNAAGMEATIVTEGTSEDSLNLDDLDINLNDLDLEALEIDGEIDVEVLKKQLGLDGKENVHVRVIKKKIDMTSDANGMTSKTKIRMKKRETIDYDLVLTEARKLLVTDMRNQAVLEIVDYAVDNGDMAQAADLVEELSTPALRDTARGRIGTGLAMRGKAEAAFAVLDSLEIDELSAPIRLEIITALMATQQERNFFNNQTLPQQ